MIQGVAGTEQVTAALKKARDFYREGFANALYRFGVHVMRQAQPKAPVLTGALRASGYVTKPEARSSSPAVQFGFGAPYAPYVHGKARYLGDPLTTAVPNALSLITGWAARREPMVSELADRPSPVPAAGARRRRGRVRLALARGRR